jgi:hypothetical protein
MDECRAGASWTRVNGNFRLIAETQPGAEQLCISCIELWPLDQEFFAVSHGPIGYECRACAKERRSSVQQHAGR